MNLRAITPLEAKRLMEAGAILIDIREADEHARERIPGARHCHCRSWMRRTIAPQRRQDRHLSLPLRRSHKKQQRPARGQGRRRVRGILRRGRA